MQARSVPHRPPCFCLVIMELHSGTLWWPSTPFGRLFWVSPRPFTARPIADADRLIPPCFVQ